MLVAHEALSLQYSRSVEDDQASPSTGFVAILAALHCSHADTVLHIYGMNWPKSLWSGHKVRLAAHYSALLGPEQEILTSLMQAWLLCQCAKMHAAAQLHCTLHLSDEVMVAGLC